jgi:hypothetical protein
MLTYNGYIFSFLLLALLGFATNSCVDTRVPKSELFYSIFVDDSSTFRNTYLGETLGEVLDHESDFRPVHQDVYGLKFQIEVSPACRMSVHYLPQSMKSGGLESPNVASIIANVNLQSEVETARLYNEIEEHFNLLYGRENLKGKYGNYSWNCSKDYISSMEVRLVLGENQKNIMLNFVDTQTGQILDDMSPPTSSVQN